MFDLSQYSDIAILILRFALAATFFYHGIKKFRHWKASDLQMSIRMVRIMRFLSLAETFGAIALFTGFLAPIVAIGLIPVMLGAIYFKVHKWNKSFSEEDGGWETDMLIIAMLISIVILGGGPFSILAL